MIAGPFVGTNRFALDSPTISMGDGGKLILCPSATSLTSVRPFVVGVDLAELGKNPGDRRGLQVLRDVVLIPRASEKFVEARVQPHHVTRTPTLPLRVMRDSPLT